MAALSGRFMLVPDGKVVVKEFLCVVLVTVSSFCWALSEEYRKLSPNCRSCNEIENLIVQHNGETSPDKRLEIALKVAKIIQKIGLKGKSATDQRREIYFSIKGAQQVLEDDFDSETCLRLLDLRTVSPQNFDYVFWRFPESQQKQILARMTAFKEDKIRPKAQLPLVKEVED